MTRHADVKALLADPRFSRDRKLTKHYTLPEPGMLAFHALL